MTLMMIATAITQLAVTIRPTCPFGVPVMRRRRAPNAAARAWIAEKTRLNFCINESLPPGCSNSPAETGFFDEISRHRRGRSHDPSGGAVCIGWDENA